MLQVSTPRLGAVQRFALSHVADGQAAEAELCPLSDPKTRPSLHAWAPPKSGEDNLTLQFLMATSLRADSLGQRWQVSTRPWSGWELPAQPPLAPQPS